MNLQKTSAAMWTNHRGQSIPRQYITAADKKKEQTVGKLFRQAESLSKKMKAFKDEAFDSVDAIYQQMLKEANIEPGKRKGNFTLTNFDKTAKIEVNVSDKIEFDDNIELAQIKLNEFLAAKTNGADPELAEIINNAFNTTKGRLDSKRILSLFSYKITNPIWVEAMELIKKSITTNSSVRYMAFYYKETPESKYELLNLNFSNL